MNRIGERIKNKRELLHLQLNDLAKRVGITSSALSQIENAKVFPSLITIKTIAVSLNTTVGELIGENEVLSQNPLIAYNKRKLVKQNDSGTTLYLLSNHDQGKLMDTYLISFEPGSDSRNIIISHPGQDFYFVYSGKIELSIDKKKLKMEKGDSYYQIAGKDIRIGNFSPSTAELLWIFSPPNI